MVFSPVAGWLLLVAGLLCAMSCTVCLAAWDALPQSGWTRPLCIVGTGIVHGSYVHATCAWCMVYAEACRLARRQWPAQHIRLRGHVWAV
jgi:hypothetical protein